MAKIVINGRSFEGYAGQSISVINGSVIVDGKKLDTSDFANEPQINVTVVGNVGEVTTDNADVTVEGNVTTVRSSKGDVDVQGSVAGNAESKNGDIRVNGSVGGSVSTKNGDIKHR